MIELPEASVLSHQINETIGGKIILDVIAAHSPHKFAWYHGDPKKYHELLVGKKIDVSLPRSHWLEIKAGDSRITFCEGINLRFHAEDEKRPQKHQLLIEFDDLTALSASIQMYGGMYCFKEGEFENEYYHVAGEKPSPLSDRFDWTYFNQILSGEDTNKLSVKALLATKQRIPGLGNGVLQDILYNAGIHPKMKVGALSENSLEALYNSIKSTLTEMALQGGRDTEKDLFGCPGGYKTVASKNNLGKPCPKCGSLIKKESYLGGSIYFCSGCQKI